MEVRILDLDGSVAKQNRLAARARRVLPLDAWGPNLRMACGWEAFGNFEVALARHLNSTRDAAPIRNERAAMHRAKRPLELATRNHTLGHCLRRTCHATPDLFFAIRRLEWSRKEGTQHD